MLNISGLNQYYGGSHILRDVSLTVARGKVTVLLGRNGVGKTTLLKSLMGVVPIRTGEITLDDTALTKLRPEQRVAKGIGYVPQGREIFGKLTVEENLRMGLASAPRGTGLPDELFTLFPVLKSMLRRRGGDLSGGQQQQLAIARALAAGPRLLILDEPTEGIQPSIIKEIEKVIRTLADSGRMGILLVEQYYEFAEALADQYAVMTRGEIVRTGAGEAMANDGVREMVAISNMLAPLAKSSEDDSSRVSPADAGPQSAWRASVDLAYQSRDGQTIPTLRRHAGPLRVLKGYRQSGPDCWEQVLVHPPGGIAGCDRLDIRVKASQETRVMMTTPGASKWYRCGEPAPADNEPAARQSVTISVVDRAGFEWLPLENIFYDGAVARLDTHFDVAPGAALIAADVFCLGRPASNAPFEKGRLEMHTRVTRNNRPLFIERARLTGGSRAMEAPLGLNGEPCFGNLIAVPAQVDGPPEDRPSNDRLGALRDRLRQALSEQTVRGEVAVTALPNVLVVRWRGPGAQAGWHALRTAWRVLRVPILNRAAQEPRIWAC